MKMKFVVKVTTEGCGRLGLISEIPRLREVTFETPALMLYTKGAAVPHLTHETLSMVTSLPQILEAPLQSSYRMEPAITKCGSSIAEFASMKEHIFYMNYMDPSAENRSGHFQMDKVPLWTKTGKIMYNANKYMDHVEAFKPDLYHAICDGSIGNNTSKKRLIKAVDRTTSMLETCIQRHEKSEYLSKNSLLLGVITASFSKEDRDRCLSKLLGSADKIHGFVLEGMAEGGPKTEMINFSEISEIFDDVTPQLPQDKIRLIHGCWNPVVILEAVSRGWDLFDSSYPTLYSEAGHALTFTFGIVDDGEFEINLKDNKYKEDFEPILQECECLSCKKHSRAYINHLLNTNELLSQVLLMIHNLHHYMRFFTVIRRSIRDGSLTELTEGITQQYQRRVDATPLAEEMDDLKPVKRKRSPSV